MACTLYLCEECGFKGRDVTELKKNVDEYHPKNPYSKRIKQNLRDINFYDDSDDDLNPNKDDNDDEESDSFTHKKRKLNEPEMPMSKKKKVEFVYNNCNKNLSGIDSLIQDIKKSCKL